MDGNAINILERSWVVTTTGEVGPNNGFGRAVNDHVVQVMLALSSG